jgi:hypothetical protein
MNPRHGVASFTADLSVPGLALVEFTSPDVSLNTVPGDLIEVHLPVLQTVVPGSETTVFLDPALTFVLDGSGSPVPLVFESDVLTIVAPLPGIVSGLTIERLPNDQLSVSWGADCGEAAGYAIYRGDLREGYRSLFPALGFCNVAATSAVLPAGQGPAEFFLVVPNADGLEGSYGILHGSSQRPAPAITCHPAGDTHECAP